MTAQASKAPSPINHTVTKVTKRFIESPLGMLNEYLGGFPPLNVWVMIRPFSPSQVGMSRDAPHVGQSRLLSRTLSNAQPDGDRGWSRPRSGSCLPQPSRCGGGVWCGGGCCVGGGVCEGVQPGQGG